MKSLWGGYALFIVRIISSIGMRNSDAYHLTAEEEISRRSGGLTPSTQGTPTRTTATNTPVAANPAAVVPSAPLTSPSPPSQPPPQQEPSPNPTPQRAHNELLNDPEPEQQPTTHKSDIVKNPLRDFHLGPGPSSSLTTPTKPWTSKIYPQMNLLVS